MWLQVVTSVAVIAASVATVFLAAMTFSTAKATKQMVNEMREARLHEYRPVVIVDFQRDPKFQQALSVTLSNVGRGLARDLSFVFEPRPVNSRGQNLAEMGCYRDGLRVLSPGRSIDCLYDTMIELLKDDTSAVRAFTVTVAYSDSTGSNAYEESFHLDAMQFRGRRFMSGESPETSLGKIAEAAGLLRSEVQGLRETYQRANYTRVSEGLRAEFFGYDYLTGKFPAEEGQNASAQKTEQ